MFGSTLLKQGQAKPDTVANYILGLGSYHVGHKMSVEVFDKARLEWITKQGNRLFRQVESTCLPISNALLDNFTERPSQSIDDLSINPAAKIVWAGLLQLYTVTKRKKASFAQMKAALSDISFVKGCNLEQSKTDTEHTRLQIL